MPFGEAFFSLQNVLFDGLDGLDGPSKGPFKFFHIKIIKHNTHIYIYIYIYIKCPDKLPVGLKIWLVGGSG